MSRPEITFASYDLVIGPRGLPVLVPRPPRIMAEIVRRQLDNHRAALAKMGE